MKNFKIPENRPFIIAEIANAHSGSNENLKKLVEKTILTKSDAIKFQFFKAKELLIQNHPEFGIYKKLEISDNIWKIIFKRLKKTKIKIFVDVFSIERAHFAHSLHADGYKIHSSDIENESLLKLVSLFKKPILLSCSGCTLNEIDNAIKIIKQNGNPQIILMHGFQGFPTDITKINLNRITSLRKRYSLSVGYMDHIDGNSKLAISFPLISLGMGVTVIEKHITLNRMLKDEDYQSSLNPDEFSEMKKLIQNSFKGLGKNLFDITGDELKYRLSMKKKIIAKKTLMKNCTIKNNDIDFKRSPNNNQIISKELIQNGVTKIKIQKNQLINLSNIYPKIKIAAIIACRVDSSRLYAKPLQLINNNPILEHIVKQLKKCNNIDDIVLAISSSTGNEKFIEFTNQHNLKYVLGDDIDVLGRIIHAADFVNANTVVRITSEDPIKYWQGIDDAVKQHLTLKSDYTECISKLPEGTGFEIIELDALKKSHKKGLKKHRSELVTLYINEHRKKFKINSFNVPKQIQKSDIRLTVDNPEDLILIRSIWKKHIKKSTPDLFTVIRLINEDKLINNLPQTCFEAANVK